MSDSMVTRPMSVLLLASLALALVGCDTQSGAPPQGEPQGAQPAERRAPTPETVRYRVDRSQAGTPIADTQVRGPDGMLRSLRSAAGKPVLLNLWATWCAPCVEELPTLDALASRVGDAAHVIALSQDLGDAAVPNAFLAERRWLAIEAWHDPDNIVGLSAGGNLPTTILYNAAGQEVLRVIGPLDWAGTEARALLQEAGI